jgi:hypothetical protein
VPEFHQQPFGTLDRHRYRGTELGGPVGQQRQPGHVMANPLLTTTSPA